MKNKIAPPFRIVEMDILFGTGIDTVSCLLDAAEDAGIFTRKGSWYSYEGKNVSQVSLCISDTPCAVFIRTEDVSPSCSGLVDGPV